MIAFDMTINFVGADLMVTNLVFSGDLEQHMRAKNIGFGEDKWIEDALVNMGFGGKIHDQINLVGLTNVSHQLEVGNVANHNRNMNASQILEPSCVGQFIEHDNVLITTLEQQTHEVRADKTASSGDQNVSQHEYDLSRPIVRARDNTEFRFFKQAG